MRVCLSQRNRYEKIEYPQRKLKILFEKMITVYEISV